MTKTQTTGSRNSSASSTFQSDVDHLAEGFGTLKNTVSDVAEGVVQTAHSGLRHARKQIEDTARSVEESGLKARDSISDMVVERPLTSIAIAAGVGAVFGALLWRR